ncbi:hypothetical protein, partial [Nonlabens ulvanivorans]|uniref:hypothetical protein n=2 Tax=Bacteroidota TaxID=976 RepID=UPI00329A19F6
MITIIVDKSTFQSLSFTELEKLSRYYKHNIAPVLVMEILGDLKKDFDPEKRSAVEIVSDFSKKLFPMQSVVNGYYKSLIHVELTGGEIPLDGRPFLQMEKLVQAEDGSKGFIVKETEEEVAIHKWKDGRFSEADHMLSKIWRDTTTQEDVLKNLQKILKNLTIPKLKSLKDLDLYVDEIISNPNFQDQLLAHIIDFYSRGDIDGVKLFNSWVLAEKPILRNYLPYSIHCLKVDLLFLFGLKNELIGVRPTNKVDLEYLFYLPFCNVFTSNDKIHKQLVPLIIRKDQMFVIGEDLKIDLRNIVEFIDKKELEEKRKFASIPPINEASLTFQIWKRYLNYPLSNFKSRELSMEEREYAKSQMDKFIRASQGEKVEFEDGESGDFIVRKTYL